MTHNIFDAFSSKEYRTRVKEMELDSLTHQETKQVLRNLQDERKSLRIENRRLRERVRQLEKGRDDHKEICHLRPVESLMIDEDRWPKEELDQKGCTLLTILDGISTLLYVMDHNTNEILYMNASSKEVFGDLVGEKCWQTLHQLNETRRETCSFCSSDLVITPLRENRFQFFEPISDSWYQAVQQSIRWLDGRLVNLEMAVDITQSKEIEERLEENEMRMHTFFDEFQGIAYQFKRRKEDGAIQPSYFYGLVEELTGYTEEDFLEERVLWPDLIHPADKDRVMKKAMSLWGNPGIVVDKEYRLLHRDGSIHWVRDIAKYVDELPFDRPLIQGTLYEITNRKLVEERLEETLSMYHALLENSPNNLSIFDGEGRYVVVSNALTDTLDLPKEEIEGKTFQDLLPPEIARDFMETITSMQKNQEILKKIHRFPRVSREKIYETFVFPVKRKDGSIQLFGAISMDITARIEAEEALRESENRFRQMADSIEEVFWLFSTETNRFLYVNPAYEKVWGRPREELYRDFSTTLKDSIYEEDRPLFREAIRRHKEGKPVDMEFRIHKDGRISWIHTRTFFIKNEEGEILRIAGISMDITKIKESQERALKSSKAKSLFLSSVSHELRTPLHAILNYADLGFEESQEMVGERISSYFHTISVCGQRLKHLINDLLDISKIEAGELTYNCSEEDIYRLIYSFKEELLEILKGKGIRLMIERPSSPIHVCVDKDRILQVLCNIVENAYKFSPPCSQIGISFEVLQSDGPAVSVKIVDEGPGIEKEYLELIFNKFYQINPRNLRREGTGLGLSICKEIVKAHGGEIYASNAPESGALITFTLPILHKE